LYAIESSLLKALRNNPEPECNAAWKVTSENNPCRAETPAGVHFLAENCLSTQ
jgi:hypothetical protein